MASLLNFGILALVLLVVQVYASPVPQTDQGDRIGHALSGVLQGVRGGSLEQILRGSFDFTNSGRTRNVANSVIDAVFNRNGGTGSGSDDISLAVGGIDRQI